MEEYLSVGQMAKKAGVTIATLHFYDQNGLLKAKRLANNRRVYSLQDIVRLEQISILKMMGFSLQEIQERILPDGDAAQIHALMSSQLDLIDEQMKRLADKKKAIEEVLDYVKDAGVFEWQKCLFLICQIQRDTNTYWMTHFYSEEDLIQAEQRAGGKEALVSILEQSQDMLVEMQAMIQAGIAPESEQAQVIFACFLELIGGVFNQKILTTPYEEIVKLIGKGSKDLPEDFRELSEFFVRGMGKYMEVNGIYGVRNSVTR